ATMAMCPASSAPLIRPGVTSMMRARPWEESVITPACDPVNERASCPRLAIAMATRAIDIRSPAVSSMSISRPGGIGLTCWARSSSSSVVSPMADTTTHTSLPALRVSTILRATRLMLSASANEDPPYFWTTKLTSGSVDARAEGPVYGWPRGARPEAVWRDCRCPDRCGTGSDRDDQGLEQGVGQLALDRLQPPPVAEDRQQLAVGAAEHL